MINRIRSEVKGVSPLIHSITNPISINQCANAALAVGARPIMAQHPLEVAQITSESKALLLNLGNITDVRMESMKISAQTAKKQKIPIVLDLVGVACSALRRNFAIQIIKEFTPDVIKGNYSEIYSLACEKYSSSGVDTDRSIKFSDIKNACSHLSARYNNTVLASGTVDIISCPDKTALVSNGTPRLADITGTGCMLGELTACFLSASDSFGASVCATAVLGISGELAQNSKGNGSFMVSLMDNISCISDNDIDKYLRLELENNEKI